MSVSETDVPGVDKLIVVGSSAGGIEALSTLVQTLPANFPAPLVFAQHLDPNRPSQLGPILERRSTLPVVMVSERVALAPGTVYVVPANRHVTIRDGHVMLEQDHNNRPRPSIDLLLSTAAQAYGERLIAVILTGTGSDGAAGAVDVKEAGGTVVIQNPQTARYPAMPLALPPTAVDHIADLERIGPLLYDLVRGARLPEQSDKSDDELNQVLTLVSRRANIDFRPYKPSTLLRRISRRMAVTHSLTMRDYAAHLETHPEEVGELAMAFLIKVTEFLRDPDAFAFLKREVLPRLIERGREHGRVLRLWSAGCATGEEPYSLALLLADTLGTEMAQWSIKIFATDLDENAIAFARRGLYPANVLRNLPEGYRTRFFEQADQGYRVIKVLRQMVIFGQQDLSRGVPFPRMDLVVCRNLLIYFKPELQQHVLDLFAYSLYPGNGYLFLGKAETARPVRSIFELIDKRWKVYRCTGGPVPLPSRQHMPPMPSMSEQRGTDGRHMPPASPATESDVMTTELEIGQLRRFNELVLRFLPTGVALIDRAYRIVSINGTARRLLGIRDTAIDQDFLHAVRGLSYAQVRAAIDTVFRERTVTTLSDLTLERTTRDDERFLTLTLMPVQLEANSAELAVINVVDVTDQVRTRRELEQVQSEQQRLLDDLRGANTRLSDMNKELQDANEELQAANEELMLAQEELQATNEEFEATNEELQATNEELETNNEELQATNEELETTNEELGARTNELHDLTRSLTTERTRLSELVVLSPVAMLVLRGPTLLVESFNPRFARMLDGREASNRPLDEVFPEPGMSDFVTRVREAFRQDVVRAEVLQRTPGQDTVGEAMVTPYAYTIAPIHDSQGKVDGVVVFASEMGEAQNADHRP